MTDFARAVRFQNVHLAIVGLIAAVFIVGMFSSDRFVTVLNIANVQDQLVALALVALAQTVVILSGGIDLSFAGLLGLLSVLFASFAGADPATFAGAYIGILALGTAIGALTGGIVAYTGIHPLIVTLATSTIMAGAALLHTKQPAGSVPIFFEDIVYARFFGFVPWGTSFAIAAYAIVGFVLWRTRFGIRIYAIGDDERAATISGVPVKRTKVLIYALSGFIAALAAIYLVGRFGVGDPRAGIGFDLRSITPVIVGGTLLAGGRGGVLGTFLAVILLALLANVLNFLNVSNFLSVDRRGSHHRRRRLAVRRKGAVMIAQLLGGGGTVRGRKTREILLLLGFLVLIWAITTVLSPRFLSVKNITDILVQAAPLGFVVIGQMIVIVVRGLDLSVASIMATAAVLSIGAFDNTATAFVAALLLGALVGGVNGYLVTYRRVTPFLATLATMIVLQGIRFAYTKGAPSGSLPETFRFLATGDIGGVPVILIVLITVAIAAHWMLERSVPGRQLLLYGDNPDAAHMAGLPVKRIVIGAYVISGVLAAMAGLFLVGYVGIVDNWTGQGYELDSIAAAVIGGASLRGGKGSVIGALMAALILVSLFNIVVILGLSIEFQMVVKGALILLAAAVYIRRGRE